MGHQVFISYASKDTARATAVSELLEGHGISCWMAHRNIPPGVVWPAAISDAIDSASLMVLIISANANASKHIQREVEGADRRQLPVVPVRIEDVAPSKGIGYFISNVQWIDVFPNDLDTYGPKLRFAINQELGRTQIQPGRTQIQNGGASGSRAAANLPKRLMLGIGGFVVVLGAVAGLVLGLQPLREGICSVRTFGFCDAAPSEDDKEPKPGRIDGTKFDPPAPTTLALARLDSAKFDETALTALARDAKSSAVRKEAQRRLDVIAAEQKNYEAVANDVDGLLWLLSEPCEACLVRDQARKRLKALVEEPAPASEQQIAIREWDRLDRAKFDEPALTALVRGKTPPAVRNEAQRRLDVIAAEQKSYEAVENDIDGLERFLSKPCEACLVRDKAKERLNTLIEARDREVEQAGAEREEKFWGSVQQSKLPEDYEAYLDRYPNGRYARLARNSIGKGEVGTPQTERSLALTPAKLEEVQKGLASLGYHPGVPTGALDETTREAIKAWQNATKFEPTGFLGSRQYAALVLESKGPGRLPPEQVTPKPPKHGPAVKPKKVTTSKPKTEKVESPAPPTKKSGANKPIGTGPKSNPAPSRPQPQPQPQQGPSIGICIGPFCIH